MLRKIRILFFEIIGDFESSQNWACMLLNSSPIDKKILAIGFILVLIIVTIGISNPNNLILYFLKIVFVTVVTFLILTWSNTFWFLIKKLWIYKLQIRRRQNINYYLKNMAAEKLKESDAQNPKGAIYMISYYNSVGFKYHAKRNGVEISLLLMMLLFNFPLFFVFNLALFGVILVYVFLYEQQSTNQVVNDIKILIHCVNLLYEENPENCRKFILENTMASVRELSSIYRAIKRLDA